MGLLVLYLVVFTLYSLYNIYIYIILVNTEENAVPHMQSDRQ